MATITLDGVVKRYGRNTVVHGVDLRIAHDEFVVLVGPSGCGKSTTLRMIAGLETVTSGEIRIGDQLVNDLPPRKRNLSMVFQNYALYPHMNVRENLSFSLKIAGESRKVIAERVAEAAEMLGLSNHLDSRPAELSGGERQRVAMGRAIVRQPVAFLLDEPLSNIDAKRRVQMRSEIKRFHSTVRTTMVYVTHDQVEAMTLADRIVVMRDGRIEQIGAPMELFNRPINTFVAGFLGSPPMNMFPAEISAGELRLSADVALPLPRHFADNVRNGQKVVLGLRPDHISPKGHGSAGGEETCELPLQVDMSEPLGSETLIYTRLAGCDALAKMLSPRSVLPGEVLTFTIALDKVHLFDADTGMTLNHGLS